MSGDTLIDPSLLDVLLHADQAIAIDTLARRRNASTTQVIAELQRLRDAGCAVSTTPRDGVRLDRAGLSTWSDYLKWKTGRTVEVYQRTGSTQDAMRRLVSVRGGAADEALVMADEQSAGRGRLGRRWHAPPGACVLMSIAVVRSPRPSVERLSLAAAVGVAEAITAVAPALDVAVGIKWPNDVMLGQRKVGGVLIESADADAASIGIGVNMSLSAAHLNAAPDDIASTATSLALAGCKVDRLVVAAAVHEKVTQHVRAADDAALLSAWRRHSVLLGREVKLRHDGRLIEGTAVDIDPAEGLIVRDRLGAMHYLPSATTSVV